MNWMASQITGGSTVCSNFCSGVDQRKHQSSASLVFVMEIHRWPVNSPRKGPITRKMFPFPGVIMFWLIGYWVKGNKFRCNFDQSTTVKKMNLKKVICKMRVIRVQAFCHCTCHESVIKWKHLPRYLPFVRGIQRSPMNSLHTVKAIDAELWRFLWSAPK